MCRFALISLFCCGFVPIGTGHALGIGMIHLNSGFDQPMDAEIEILSVRPGETDEMFVSLASEEAFIRAGVERRRWQL